MNPGIGVAGAVSPGNAGARKEAAKTKPEAHWTSQTPAPATKKLKAKQRLRGTCSPQAQAANPSAPIALRHPPANRIALAAITATGCPESTAKASSHGSMPADTACSAAGPITAKALAG